MVLCTRCLFCNVNTRWKYACRGGDKRPVFVEWSMQPIALFPLCTCWSFFSTLSAFPRFSGAVIRLSCLPLASAVVNQPPHIQSTNKNACRQDHKVSTFSTGRFIICQVTQPTFWVTTFWSFRKPNFQLPVGNTWNC